MVVAALPVALPGNLPTHGYPHPTIASQTRAAGSIRGRGGRRCKRRFRTSTLTANTDTMVPPPHTPFKAARLRTPRVFPCSRRISIATMRMLVWDHALRLVEVARHLDDQANLTHMANTYSL